MRFFLRYRLRVLRKLCVDPFMSLIELMWRRLWEGVCGVYGFRWAVHPPKDQLGLEIDTFGIAVVSVLAWIFAYIALLASAPGASVSIPWWVRASFLLGPTFILLHILMLKILAIIRRVAARVSSNVMSKVTEAKQEVEKETAAPSWPATALYPRIGETDASEPSYIHHEI